MSIRPTLETPAPTKRWSAGREASSRAFRFQGRPSWTPSCCFDDFPQRTGHAGFRKRVSRGTRTAGMKQSPFWKANGRHREFLGNVGTLGAGRCAVDDGGSASCIKNATKRQGSNARVFKLWGNCHLRQKMTGAPALSGCQRPRNIPWSPDDDARTVTRDQGEILGAK